MLNDSKWIRVGEMVYELISSDNESIAVIAYNENKTVTI